MAIEVKGAVISFGGKDLIIEPSEDLSPDKFVAEFTATVLFNHMADTDLIMRDIYNNLRSKQ